MLRSRSFNSNQKNSPNMVLSILKRSKSGWTRSIPFVLGQIMKVDVFQIRF